MKTSLARYPSRLAVAIRAAYAGSALLVVSLLSPALRAQTDIIFGSPLAVSGPTDIVTTGTFHAAIGATAANVTVNGVTFATSSPLISVTGATAVTSTMGSFSSGDANYDSLINRGYITDVAGVLAQVNLSGLTAGHQYRVQVWTPAWSATIASRLWNEDETTFDFGNTATAPTYLVGSFTAGASTEPFYFSAQTGSFGLMSAVAVYDLTAIPEPSTYAAIAGLGALGLALWRRRSRRAAAGGTG